MPSQVVQSPEFGVNIYGIEEGLIDASPSFFKTDSVSARVCLSMVGNVSDILKLLLQNGQTTKAGRLAGAFRNIGKPELADEIIKTMKSFSHVIREVDPFENRVEPEYMVSQSPYENRLALMWREMRKSVIEVLPTPNSARESVSKRLTQIEAKYKQDSYNSLSIEGYRVSDELIERVKSGKWNPELNDADHGKKDALAARGYYECFQKVKDSVRLALKGENAGEVFESSLQNWYSSLFMPSVNAGILRSSDLVGYRSTQVYIKNSMHTPLTPQGVRAAMPALFKLLEEESDARVRSVLGHFMFVYIHPYMDGNGRIARFLMNLMLTSGGFNWTIIPMSRRDEYIGALESASVRGDIVPFTKFIASLL